MRRPVVIWALATVLIVYGLYTLWLVKVYQSVWVSTLVGALFRGSRRPSFKASLGWFFKVRRLRLSIEVRSVVQAGHAVVKCSGCLTFSCCSDALNVALPAECLVLVLKPSECLLKMLWVVIWPIFVANVKIRVNGLHGKEAAQTPAPTPAHN